MWSLGKYFPYIKERVRMAFLGGISRVLDSGAHSSMSCKDFSLYFLALKFFLLKELTWFLSTTDVYVISLVLWFF